MVAPFKEGGRHPKTQARVRLFFASFNPLSLFANGEQGAWYDPSDLTTLYQDAAGTIPVAADGDPVGLMLDKSQGLVLGPEQNSNSGGPFSSLDGYTATNSAIIQLVSGRIEVFVPSTNASTAGVYFDVAVSPGVTQKINMDLEAQGRTFTARVYDGASFSTQIASDAIQLGVRADYSFIVTPTTSTIRVYLFDSSATDRTLYIGSASVKELPGNHATQSVAASRPLYRDVAPYQDYDAVDDSMITSLPTAPAAATVAIATPAGAVINYPVDLSGGSYTINQDHSGIIILDRQLTASEIANVTTYLNKRAGV